MKMINTKVSVIMCAHNEEKYVGKSLRSVKRALSYVGGEIVFVADRCSDRTPEIAREIGVDKLIIKNWRRWRNSYAEALQVGFRHASCKYISIVDADIVVPSDFFVKMLSELNKKENVASVSAKVETLPSTLINKIIWAWEKTYEISPLGKEPRGAARVIKREALEVVGGFRDVRSPDTDLDLRLRKLGYRSKLVETVKVWHIRENTIGKVVRNQLSAGIARYELNIGFKRTLAHSLFRMRPLVIWGWIYAFLKHHTS